MNMDFFKHTQFDHLVELFYDIEKSMKGSRQRTKEQLVFDFSDMLKFTSNHFINHHEDEHYLKILRRFGFEKHAEKYDKAILIMILKCFVKENSLDTKFIDSTEFPKEHLVEAGSTYIVSENFNAGVTVAGAAVQSEKNHCVAPTFDKLYITGHSELDNYIRWTLIFRHNFQDFGKASKFQKLVLLQLNQYLAKKIGHVARLYREQAGSRFKRNGQLVLGDYLENLMRYNLSKFQKLQKYKMIPYLLEMNGKPGIGKSSYVDFLSSLLHVIFPFYEESDMVYTRVNDKFWNGYKQQPLVLYDDQNQNKELRYNLDNEIIALGSGQFVHPPMAFEKDAKFSSLFVVFTTNKRLLQTTKADKGAIDRRVHTYQCEPHFHLGSYFPSEFGGEYWKYDDDVILNPFNLKMNGRNFVFNIYDFLHFIYGQRNLQFEEKSQLYYLKERETKQQLSFDELLNKQQKPVERLVSQFAVRSQAMIQKFPQEKLKEKDETFLSMFRVDNEVDSFNRKISQIQNLKTTGFWASKRCDPVIDTLKAISKDFKTIDPSRAICTTWNSKAVFESGKNVVHLKYEITEDGTPTILVTVVSVNDRKIIEFFWLFNLDTGVLTIPTCEYKDYVAIKDISKQLLTFYYKCHCNLSKYFATYDLLSDHMASAIRERCKQKNEALEFIQKWISELNSQSKNGFYFVFFGEQFEKQFSLIAK